MQSITVEDLAERLGQGAPIRLLDVRRVKARIDSGVQIEGAQWRNPALWLDWKDEIAQNLPIVVYCAHGHEISQGLTATLQAMGADARHLEGGIFEWLAQGKAVATIQAEGEAT